MRLLATNEVHSGVFQAFSNSGSNGRAIKNDDVSVAKCLSRVTRRAASCGAGTGGSR